MKNLKRMCPALIFLTSYTASAETVTPCRYIWWDSVPNRCETSSGVVFEILQTGRPKPTIGKDTATGMTWAIGVYNFNGYPDLVDNQAEASASCQQIGMRLPTGWPEAKNNQTGPWIEFQNGMELKKADSFPNFDSELTTAIKHGLLEIPQDSFAWISSTLSASDSRFAYLLLRTYSFGIPQDSGVISQDFKRPYYPRWTTYNYMCVK